MSQNPSILAVDVSGVAHNVWHTIDASTPSLEKKTFRTQLFRAIYQAVLETSPDTIFFMMDSASGYWRHEVYKKFYWNKVSVALDESGTLWMTHDLATYAIEQVGMGIFAKNEKKQDEIPSLQWTTLEAAETAPEFQSYLTQITDHYPKYKGGRNKSKWAQTTSRAEWIEYLKEVTEEIAQALGGAVVQVDKAEADDLMASLAVNKGADRLLYIMAEDSDMDQLQCYPFTMRYRISTKEFVVVEDPTYGVRLKTLTGDKSDNIKSIKRLVPRKPTKKDPRTMIWKSTGVDGASEILAAGNVVSRAKEEGWLEQLEFNSTMIYLGSAPAELKGKIMESMRAALKSIRKSGSIYNFGIPADEIKLMRSVAVVKKVKFSDSGTVEDGK